MERFRSSKWYILIVYACNDNQNIFNSATLECCVPIQMMCCGVTMYSICLFLLCADDKYEAWLCFVTLLCTVALLNTYRKTPTFDIGLSKSR